MISELSRITTFISNHDIYSYMPNYSVSVSSEDNMIVAKKATECGMTVEQYLKGQVHEIATSIKEGVRK